MTNRTEIVGLLEGFSADPTAEKATSLRFILEDLALAKELSYSWRHVKPLLLFEANKNLRAFVDRQADVESQQRLSNYVESLITALDKFNVYPFTIQRICELILQPDHHYRMAVKALDAIEKLVVVTSGLDYCEETSPVTIEVDRAEDAETPQPE
eukprot:TRINITY_DN11902_c0_g1_i1.p1 TRINITY_DN11902_c0_g1~~TRINITY_DN11902_c0_g1_i1.p1  ORF type:complete len:155 (-),score=25.95 TRINITY_DN11902_c0_g1_i1:210-674(-)